MGRKRKQQPERSPAWQLLAHVWEHSLKETGHSWLRLNQSMHQALALAVRSGCFFGLGDFAGLEDAFRFSRWGGVDRGGFAEWFYTLAVREGNLSAVKSFEAWKGRGPFIADGRHNRTRGRLAVDSRFTWQGEQVRVTSFSKCGTYLTACIHKQRTKAEMDDPYSKRQIKHRYKITAADIQADRKARKARDRLEAAIAGRRTATQERILQALGVTERDEWNTITPEQIEQAIKEAS